MTSVKIIGVNLKPSSYSGFALMSSIIVKCIEMSATGIRFWGRGSFGSLPRIVPGISLHSVGLWKV